MLALLTLLVLQDLPDPPPPITLVEAGTARVECGIPLNRMLKKVRMRRADPDFLPKRLAPTCKGKLVLTFVEARINGLVTQKDLLARFAAMPGYRPARWDEFMAYASTYPSAIENRSFVALGTEWRLKGDEGTFVAVAYAYLDARVFKGYWTGLGWDGYWTFLLVKKS